MKREATIGGFRISQELWDVLEPPTCEGCGETFDAPAGQRFCSPSCQIQAEAETTSYAQRFREKMNKPADPSDSKLK